MFIMEFGKKARSLITQLDYSEEERGRYSSVLIVTVIDIVS